MTPASMFWRRKTCKKYVSRGGRSAPPLMCPMPEPSLPGTLRAPGLVAIVAGVALVVVLREAGL